VQPALALLPLFLILGLMVGLQWSAAAAGLIGFVVSAGIAIVAFGYGEEIYPNLGIGYAVGGALVEALFSAGAILWIIFPALCIYELQQRAGAFEVLRTGLARVSSDRKILAILVAWFFALFLEGAAGFGTPVALAAPLLVSLGFAPLQAVALALIGHAAGVSFGAVGTPIFPQVLATSYTGIEIARGTALMHALLGGILLFFFSRIVDRGTALTCETRSHWGWVALAAPCFLVPSLAIALFVGPELPTLLGALVGGAIFVGLLRLRRRVTRPNEAGRISLPGRTLGWAMLPYIVLLILIIATRLIVPLQQILHSVIWQWSLLGEFSGSFQPLYHPGSMVLLGFIIGGTLQGRPLGDLGAAAASAARRMAPVVVALVAMLALSRIMVHAGMVVTVAEAAALAFGSAWPLMVPAIGALGSFITGSATASNILLTGFQQAAAQALALPVLPLVSAQGFGAAVGNIICPHNIIAGVATVGLQGHEGDVLQRTVLACICYAVAGGVLLLIMVQLVQTT